MLHKNEMEINWPQPKLKSYFGSNCIRNTLKTTSFEYNRMLQYISRLTAAISQVMCQRGPSKVLYEGRISFIIKDCKRSDG